MSPPKMTVPKRSSTLRRLSAAALACACVFSLQAADLLVPGIVKREVYPNATRDQVLSNTAGSPSSVTFPTLFETPVDSADNYAHRLSGLFIPAVSGNYVFFLASDDDGDLYLSTDANPANKRLIAQETGYSGSRSWVTIGGGTSSPDQKRSDYFSPDGGLTYPFTSGIPLVAGQQYYIEAVAAEGGGGDNLSATFKLFTDIDPANGDITKLTGDLIAVSVPAPTTLTIPNQPENTTVHAGVTGRLTVGAATDSQVPPSYQWRRNGTDIPGATGSSYSFVATAADNGVTYDVVVSVPGLTATSSSATVTVPETGAVTVSGLKQEVWEGVSRQDVEAGRVGEPTFVRQLDSFESAVDFSNNYSQRISGYFTPDTTGDYVFLINSDDDSDLFLSTDANPANKRLIAQETAWSGSRAWATGGNLTQKRSDTWSPDAGVTMPYSAGIPLTAGQTYYIEAVHHEGGGGDNLAATFKLLTEADPADGDPSRLTGSLVSLETSPVSSLTIIEQPHNVTANEGAATNMSVRVETDAELSPTYQWRTNGVDVAGGTNATLAIPNALLGLNGVRYSVVVGLPGFTNTVTSSEATLTVESGVLAYGFLKREVWPGQTRPNVLSGAAGISTNVSIITSGEAAPNVPALDNFASRISGYFIPPTSGNYVFFLAADDDTDLFLSTDENPVNKKLIAQEASWSNQRAWNTPGGSSTIDNKRSDFFLSSEWPTPNVITLTGGQRYYLEAVHHDGSSGDHVHITYKLDTEPDPVDGDPTRLTGDNIAFLAPEATITISQQPQSVTGLQNQTVTFNVAASTSSPFPGLAYQWLKNGTEIAGATSAEYTTGLLSLADNNAQYSVRVSGPGAADVTSEAATLTFNADPAAPTITSAGAFTGATSVGVSFSEALDPASITAGAFQVSGATVTAATLRGNNFVELTLAAPVGASFTVTATGVKDLAGNTIAASPVNGVISDLIAQDLGTSGIDPAEPGFAVSAGDSFYLAGGGSDLWNAADGGFIVYKQFTGPFDMRARIDSLIGGDEWGKAALMARETIEPGSRNEAVLITKPGVYEGDAVGAVTPSVQGMNVYNHQWRNATDGASESKAAAERISPTVFPSWLRLVRESTDNNEFKSYISYDGEEWILYHTHTTTGETLPATMALGMVVTAHDNAPGFPKAQAVFSEFSIEPFQEVGEANLAITRTGNQITITWDSGTLEAADTIDGTFAPVQGASDPYTVTPGSAMRFFRVRN